MELEFLQIKLVIHKKLAIYKNRKQTKKTKKQDEYGEEIGWEDDFSIFPLRYMLFSH